MTIDLIEQYRKILVNGINRLNKFNRDWIDYWTFSGEYEKILGSLLNIERKIKDDSLDSREILELRSQLLKLKVNRDINTWSERYDK